MFMLSFDSDELVVLVRAILNYRDLNENRLLSMASDDLNSDYESYVRENFELSKSLLDKLTEDLPF